MPIRGAEVRVIFPSFDGPMTTTGAHGQASIGNPWPFDVYGIRIGKDGFLTDDFDWPEQWPVEVTLHPGDSGRPPGHATDMFFGAHLEGR